jgi:hypothetical protein
MPNDPLSGEVTLMVCGDYCASVIYNIGPGGVTSAGLIVTRCEDCFDTAPEAVSSPNAAARARMIWGM